MDAIVLCDRCNHSLPKNSGTPHFQALHLDDMLRANQPPSHAEAEQTRSCIENTQYELAMCTQELLRLRSAVLQLEIHQCTLSRRIEHCHSWIHSPIRQLPPEVLESIFAFACLFSECSGYSGRLCSVNPEPSYTATPALTLSHVSCHWRSIVTACPRLWSSINLQMFARCGSDNALSLLGHYLTNSKDHPLELTPTYQVYYFPYTNAVSAVRILSKNMSRFTRLELCQKPGLPDWIIQDPFLNDATEFVEVKVHYGYLTHLLLPYHQLKTLEVVNVGSVQDLIPVFNLCTKLHTLRLSTSIFMEDLPTDEAAHTPLHYLRHLSITARHDGILSQLLSRLSTPALASSELTVPDLASLVPFTDLIQRSNCHLSLNKLVVNTHQRYDQNPSDSRLHDLLVSCPALSQLRVKVSHPADLPRRRKDRETFAYRLFGADSQGKGILDLAPGLVELSVDEQGSSIDPGAANALVDMLEAKTGRLQLYLRFDALTACSARDLGAFNARLGKLAEKGLVCRIRWAEVV